MRLNLIIYVCVLLLMAGMASSTNWETLWIRPNQGNITINNVAGGSGNAINNLGNTTRCVTSDDDTINCSSAGETAMFYNNPSAEWYFNQRSFLDINQMRADSGFIDYLYLDGNTIQGIIAPVVIDGSYGVSLEYGSTPKAWVESSRTAMTSPFRTNSSGADAIEYIDATGGVYDAIKCWQLDGVDNYYMGVDDSNNDAFIFGSGCGVGSGVIFDYTSVAKMNFRADTTFNNPVTISKTYFKQVIDLLPKNCVSCDVKTGNIFKTQSTGAVTVTGFINAADGRYDILCADALTSFQNNTNIRLANMNIWNCTKASDYCNFIYDSANSLMIGDCKVV